MIKVCDYYKVFNLIVFNNLNRNLNDTASLMQCVLNLIMYKVEAVWLRGSTEFGFDFLI